MLQIDKNILKGFDKEEREVVGAWYRGLAEGFEGFDFSVDNIVTLIDYLLLLDHPEGNVEACKLLQRGLEIAPDDVDLQLFQAQISLLFFRPDEAVRIADKLIAENVSEALVIKAQTLAQMRRHETNVEVINLLKQYLRIETDGRDTVCLDVINYRPDRIDYELYITVLRYVIKENMDSGRSLNSIAILCSTFFDEESILNDVIELYQLYLQHQPYHLNALVGYAEALHMKGLNGRAAEVAELYVDLMKDDAERLPALLLDAADYLIQDDQMDKALEHIMHYVALRPDAGMEESRELLSDNAYICGIKTSFNMMYAICLLHQEMYEQAIKAFSKVVERDDIEKCRALRFMSQTYSLMNNEEQALMFAYSAVTASSGAPLETATSYRFLGQYLITLAMIDKKNMDEYLRDAENAVNTAEEILHDGNTYVSLAMIKLLKNDCNEAEMLLTHALDEQPDNPMALSALTALHIKRQEFDEAERVFRLLDGFYDTSRSTIMRLAPNAKDFFEHLSL